MPTNGLIEAMWAMFRERCMPDVEEGGTQYRCMRAAWLAGCQAALLAADEWQRMFAAEIHEAVSDRAMGAAPMPEPESPTATRKGKGKVIN